MLFITAAVVTAKGHFHPPDGPFPADCMGVFWLATPAFRPADPHTSITGAPVDPAIRLVIIFRGALVRDCFFAGNFLAISIIIALIALAVFLPASRAFALRGEVMPVITRPGLFSFMPGGFRGYFPSDTNKIFQQFFRDNIDHRFC